MKWSHNHSFNPDRDEINMRWEFQLIETDNEYILVLDEEDYAKYPKSAYSQIMAEAEALDTVEQAKEKHGEHNVYFHNGLNHEVKKAYGKLPDLCKMAKSFFDQVKTV